MILKSLYFLYDYPPHLYPNLTADRFIIRPKSELNRAYNLSGVAVMQEFLANIGLYTIFSITCIVIAKWYDWYREKEIRAAHYEKKEHQVQNDK
jgi:hypothetical protein